MAKTAIAAGIVAFILGAAGLAGWITGNFLLGGFGGGYIPMAPNTAVLVMAFGAALLACAGAKPQGIGRPVAIAVVVLASIYGGLEFAQNFIGADLTFEQSLFPVTAKLGRYPLGRMSPYSGLLFFLSGASLLLCYFGRGRPVPRNASTALGAAVLIAGASASMGYLFGTPLLYGGTAVPLAATTAAAFLALGCGLTILAGPESFIVRRLTGPAASAGLLRGILPVVVLAILLQGLLGTRLSGVLDINQALLSAILALAFMAATVLVVVRATRLIFRKADRAEAERRSAEKALLESEERYRTLFENSHAVMLIIEPDAGSVVDANPAAAAYYGWTRDELRGMRIGEINMLSAPDLKAELDRARRAERRQFFFRHRRADGSIRDVEVYSGPITLGERHLLFSIIHDITERKRTEEALRESEERFRQIAEHAGEFIWETDAEGLFTYVNPVAERILGYKPEELVGKIRFYDLLAPDVREDLKAASMAAFARRESFRGFVNPNVKKDGALVILETNGFPILGGAGTLIGFRGVDTDITERKKVEGDLRQAVKQKGILMKELQHRVKNSLGVVSGLLGLEMERLPDEASRRIFAETRARIRSVASLYEQLYGGEESDSANLGRYLRRVAEALSQSYIPSGIALKMELEEVRLDTKRAVPLGLILNELVTNALKYAYPGDAKGEVRVALRTSGGRLSLSVEDDGVGLPADFDPAVSGGMGMNLVRMLSDQIDAGLSMGKNGGTRISVSFEL